MVGCSINQIPLVDHALLLPFVAIFPSRSIGFSDALMKGAVVVVVLMVVVQKICALGDPIYCHDIHISVADVSSEVFDAILMQRLETASQNSLVPDRV
jgi:hypothetical protein